MVDNNSSRKKKTFLLRNIRNTASSFSAFFCIQKIQLPLKRTIRIKGPESFYVAHEWSVHFCDVTFLADYYWKNTRALPEHSGIIMLIRPVFARPLLHFTVKWRLVTPNWSWWLLQKSNGDDQLPFIYSQCHFTHLRNIWKKGKLSQVCHSAHKFVWPRTWQKCWGRLC